MSELVDNEESILESAARVSSRVAKALGVVGRLDSCVSPSIQLIIADILDRREAAEKALFVIGEKAVCDWDDPTVGEVDAVLKEVPQKYIDWYKKLMFRREEMEATCSALVESQLEICELATANDKLKAELSEAHAQIERLRCEM